MTSKLPKSFLVEYEAVHKVFTPRNNFARYFVESGEVRLIRKVTSDPRWGEKVKDRIWMQIGGQSIIADLFKVNDDVFCVNLNRRRTIRKALTKYYAKPEK